MSFQVDVNGYRLDNQGNRIETSEADRNRFRQQIEQALEANGISESEASGQSIMIVESGDYIWKIAGEMGADPAQTAYENNKQFENPDLIHPGDVVLVDKITNFSSGPTSNGSETTGGVEDPNGSETNGEQTTNVNAFADQIWSDVSAVTNGDGQNTDQKFDAIRTDIENYLGTVPGDQFQGAVEDLIFNTNWDDHEGVAGRQLAMDAYLGYVPEGDRAEHVGWLTEVANDPEKDLPNRTGYLQDVKEAVHDLILESDWSQPETRQQTIQAYLEATPAENRETAVAQLTTATNSSDLPQDVKDAIIGEIQQAQTNISSEGN